MKKLGTMKECYKCGWNSKSIVYVLPLIQETISGNNIMLEDEYMEVECTRCGYKEKELPLDAEVKDERNT